MRDFFKSVRYCAYTNLNKLDAVLEGKTMSEKLSVPILTRQVSVLVVDDADVIRRTLRNFLKEEPAIKLLGEASNFAEAISMTVVLKEVAKPAAIMVMDSWWQLGETSGLQGDKLDVWRLTCPFCNEKGNFSPAFHGEKKKSNSNKRLNFDVYQCRNCMGYVHVFWSAGEFGFPGRNLYSFHVLPWPLKAKPEPSENWPEGMKRFWIQAHDTLTNENWDAANLMARSALQFVVRERGAVGRNLKEQIDDLANKSVLHPLMHRFQSSK